MNPPVLRNWLSGVRFFRFDKVLLDKLRIRSRQLDFLFDHVSQWFLKFPSFPLKQIRCNGSGNGGMNLQSDSIAGHNSVLQLHMPVSAMHRKCLENSPDFCFRAVRVIKPGRFNLLDCIFAMNFYVSGCPSGEIGAQAKSLTTSK